MLNVGVIGCGKIAQVRHIPEYLENESVKLVGYFDLNSSRSAELAQKFGGIAYSSWEQLIQDDSIDAVSVCTTNITHAEISIAALNAGKHVLCEKPMATTLAECKAMVDAAKSNNKTLFIGQNQRLNKAHVMARKLLADGVIGRIITYTSTFGHSGPEKWSIDVGAESWFFNKDLAKMGAMADLGIHKTDLIRFLTSDDIVEVTAKLECLDKCGVDGSPISLDDNAFCIYKMKNGAIGVMRASWTFYGEEDNSTIIYGTKGIMKIFQNPTFAIEVIYEDGDRTFYQTDRMQTNEDQTYSGVIDAFVSGVMNNEAPQISGEDVLESMRAVFSAIESAEKGRTVKVYTE